MLASLIIGFNNTNAELDRDLLKPVRATYSELCQKILSIRNFVPQRKRLRISILILFSTNQN